MGGNNSLTAAGIKCRYVYCRKTLFGSKAVTGDSFLKCYASHFLQKISPYQQLNIL